MNTFQLNISSPDGKIFEGAVRRITVRGVEGDLAVMAGHVPFMTAVRAGDCVLHMADDSIRRSHTEGGLLTVAREGVTFLTSALTWE
ncbi:MAG: FoF1 ATP synthase subunit delta/epsilon [Aristaeellaceae bacterium]